MIQLSFEAIELDEFLNSKHVRERRVRDGSMLLPCVFHVYSIRIGMYEYIGSTE